MFCLLIRPTRVLTGLFAAAVVLACGATPLPVDATWLPGKACFGVGLDATLQGSAGDRRITWALDNGTGARFELQWPAGYSAHFSPGLEVLDDGGRVVGRAGDAVIGGCRSQAAEGLFLVSGTDLSPASD